MRLTICLPAVFTFLSVLPLQAAAPERLDDLMAALRFDEVAQVIALEGAGYGDTLRDEMFPRGDAARWGDLVARIYDPDRMAQMMQEQLSDHLADQDLAPMIAFYGSEPARQIVELELAARRALLDDAVDDAADARLAEMQGRDDPRLKQLDRMIEGNAMVERNVVGAMNANFAFYRGLVAGGITPELDEADMLRQIWAGEELLREDTAQWLYSFLVLAYDPVSDADLDTYIDFALTDTGRMLDAALYDSFEVLFSTISNQLGLGAAQFLQLGDEL